jgi:hypothetical protein
MGERCFSSKIMFQRNDVHIALLRNTQELKLHVRLVFFAYALASRS